ncbi:MULTISPECIES: hypothetical protein [Pseudomonas]|uniref:hypothetical protein n=1 Tax=Pseudomonas TaxID=286 RepID=UPI001BB32EE3|nr:MULTISPECIES: hypothetical protein [Pseudomonas]MCD9113476.1 hypothetical protein [Pseudomonas bijieensis]UQI29397.1 hypothetical protein M3M50_20875 [Pseudomonas bijieensis]WLH61144.1 hypothetical protein PSH86_20715 [Pseudomonas sp. FP2300]BBH34415.1 putative uncharacterized protein [Pseudomonas sp. St290]
MELMKDKPQIAIVSLDLPSRTQGRDVSWKCSFLINNPKSDGYLIQKVTITTREFSLADEVFVEKTPNQTVTYWESWKISKGINSAGNYRDTGSFLSRDFNDIYHFPSAPPQTRKIEYVIGHLEFYTGNLTEDFKSGNDQTFAGPIPSTTTKPDDWPETRGPFHNMYVCHLENDETIVATYAGELKLFHFNNLNEMKVISGLQQKDIINYFKTSNGDIKKLKTDD